MKNNFFEYGSSFHQTGIAMGAAFSPTVANIFMSVLLKDFMSKSNAQPHVLVRYIDDILIIWPKTQDHEAFLNSLNKFHPNIKFTVTTSNTSIDYLDVTIYRHNDPSSSKSPSSTKTLQKEKNLYQYLHFSSAHPKKTFKGLIMGECIRYVRTNSTL